MNVAQPDVENGNPFGEPNTRARLFEIESKSDFWNHNPQLQTIYHAAMDENVSPWGLLVVLMAHRLSHVPPNVVLVKTNGKEGKTLVAGCSFNTFVGLVAPTGRGKSVTFRLATEMIPPFGMPLPDGTGQGIVKAFAERVKVTKDEEGKPVDKPYMVTRYHTHALVIHAPEVATLNAEFAREGSKTGGMMRSLWVGETLGMTNAEAARAGAINANMARLCGIWGVQPHNAYAIMGQAGDGTPQRFLWAPARDRRFRHHPELLTNVAQPPPLHTLQSPFPFPVFSANPAQQAMGTTLPTEIRDDDPLPEAIWVHRTSEMAAAVAAADDAYELALGDHEESGDLPDDVQAKVHAALMQGHSVLMRIKVAVALGFLWGHRDPDDLDWYLAGVLMEISNAEAAGVWKACEKNRLKDAADRGHTRGIEQDAADVARNLQRDARAGDMASTFYPILAREGGCTEKGLARHISKTKRPFIRDGLRHMEDQGKAKYDGTMWFAVYNGNAITTPSTKTVVDQFALDAALEASHRAVK